MKYYLKRGKWCVRDGSGLRKFPTEEAARMYVEGTQPTAHVEMPKYFEKVEIDLDDATEDTTEEL